MRYHEILISVILLGMVGGGWAQSWPNEPAGSTNLLDWNFSFRDGNGWTCYCADVSVISDGTAPHSPSFVGQWRYNTGMAGGISPGNLYRALPGLREIYVGYWWKASAGFSGHPSSVNKMLFLVGGGNFVPEMFGSPGGPYKLMLCLEAGADNCHLPSSYGDCPGTRMVYANTGNASLVPGSWYRIELYLKHSSSTTSKDGIVRAWVNGALTHNFTNVNYQASAWTELQINPTWGGMGSTVGATSYFWYDHMRISKPNGGVPEPVMPLSITTTSMPSGRAGSPYSATLQAANGKAPYSWTITSGSLLPGLSLNKTTGVISGTLISGGRSDFIVKVLDSNVPPKEASKAFNIIASGSTGISTSYLASSGAFGVEVSKRRVRFLMSALAGSNRRLNVFDLSGKSIFACRIASGEKAAATENLGNGIYFAVLGHGQQEWVVRFSVMH